MARGWINRAELQLLILSLSKNQAAAPVDEYKIPYHRQYLLVSFNFMTDAVFNFKVTDRQTFSKFITLLRQDFVDNSENWESKKLDDFFEALSSYAEGIQGYYDNTKQNVNADVANWQTFADIFKGATLYE